MNKNERLTIPNMGYEELQKAIKILRANDIPTPYYVYVLNCRGEEVLVQIPDSSVEHFDKVAKSERDNKKKASTE